MESIAYGLAVPLAAAAMVLLVVVLRVLGERAATRPRHLHRSVSGSPAGRGTHPGSSKPVRTSLPAADEDSGGIEVHECATALDVAQLLLDNGQSEGAARILANLVESNPRQALTPWLKLLEIYRRAGAREEYETVAQGLHEHFNLHAAAWDRAQDGACDGIEAYHHVMTEIRHRWGSRACRHYLGHLLADNRGGQRSGFSAAALEDILLLIDVLEPQLKRAPAATAGSPRLRSIAPRIALHS